MQVGESNTDNAEKNGLGAGDYWCDQVARATLAPTRSQLGVPLQTPFNNVESVWQGSSCGLTSVLQTRE